MNHNFEDLSEEKAKEISKLKNEFLDLVDSFLKKNDMSNSTWLNVLMQLIVEEILAANLTAKQKTEAIDGICECIKLNFLEFLKDVEKVSKD